MTTARQRRSKDQPAGSTATDYRADLWRMADALRGSMDAADYKHVVLGLIFLKYISDAFEELHSELEKERDQGADPEDRDEYLAQNIFLGAHRGPLAQHSGPMPDSPTSARPSMQRWLPWSGITRR